jgi:RsiW-degrading membrane proteinase PrsW (M82 family)
MQILVYVAFAVLTVLVTVAPAVLYSLLVWWLDRYEKEPWGLLAATFIWGAIPAIVVSLVAEFALGIPFSGFFGDAAAELIQGSVIAPVVEEVAKGLVILALFLVFRREFDGVLDGIVYGALVGFGFAMTENGLYFLGALAEGGTAAWLSIVFVRTTVFGLNHGLFSGIVGMGFGYASIVDSAWKRWLAPVACLGAAIVVHAVHNLSASMATVMCWPILISLVNDWGGVLVLMVIVLLSWNRERGWIARELGEEVSAATISQSDYDSAVSYQRRVGAQWRALTLGGLADARRVRRFHQLATELAFAKRRLRSSPADEKSARIVSRLREELLALDHEVPQH